MAILSWDTALVDFTLSSFQSIHLSVWLTSKEPTATFLSLNWLINGYMRAPFSRGIPSVPWSFKHAAVEYGREWWDVNPSRMPSPGAGVAGGQVAIAQGPRWQPLNFQHKCNECPFLSAYSSSNVPPSPLPSAGVCALWQLGIKAAHSCYTIVQTTRHLANMSSRYWKLAMGVECSEELQVPSKKEVGMILFFEKVVLHLKPIPYYF